MENKKNVLNWKFSDMKWEWPKTGSQGIRQGTIKVKGTNKVLVLEDNKITLGTEVELKESGTQEWKIGPDIDGYHSIILANQEKEYFLTSDDEDKTKLSIGEHIQSSHILIDSYQDYYFFNAPIKAIDGQ